MTWNMNYNLGNNLFDGVNANSMLSVGGINANAGVPATSFNTPQFDFSGMGNTGINSTSGWNTFSNILGGVTGLANAFTGFKQLGLAKKQFAWQKDAFNTNLVNQANLVNSQLADRQRRRQFFDSSALSPEQYLAKYGAASSVQEAKGRQEQNLNAWTKSKALNTAANSVGG